MKCKVTEIFSWRTFNVFNYFFCCVCCLWQSYQVIIPYFQYEVSIAFVPTWLTELHMPGLTICSTIGVTLTQLQIFCDLIGSNVTDDTRATCYIKYLKNNSVYELASNGLDFDQFVRLDQRKCLLDYDESNNTHNDFKDDYSLSLFYYPFKCWSLFHVSRFGDPSIEFGYGEAPFISESYDDDSLDSSSEQAIEPNELLRFQINFTSSEKPFEKITSQAYMYIHPKSAIGRNVFERVNLKKSRDITTDVKIMFYRNLPAPYETDCHNYTQAALNRRHGLDPETYEHPYLFPLSEEDCFSGCISRAAIKSCNCWPPEIPYLMVQNTTNSPSLCMWTTEHDFSTCYGDQINSCRDRCPTECAYTEFLTSIHSDKLWIDENVDCCGLASVKILGQIHFTVIYEPKYVFIEILSTVGSIVGTWFGYCFADVVAVRKYLLATFYQVKEKKKSETSLNTMNSSKISSKTIYKSKDKSIDLHGWRPRRPVYRYPFVDYLTIYSSTRKIHESHDSFIPWYMNKDDPSVRYTFTRNILSIHHINGAARARTIYQFNVNKSFPSERDVDARRLKYH